MSGDDCENLGRIDYRSVLLGQRWTILATVAAVLAVTLVWTITEDRPSPHWTLNLGLAVIGSLGLGVGFAFRKERRGDVIRSDEGLAWKLGVPLLGIVPEAEFETPVPTPALTDVPAPDRGENRLEFVSHNEPQSGLTAAYRAVRTSLGPRFGAEPQQAILITSCLPSEGKTTTAINLAISLAETGTPTLLVSTDFRRPRTDEVFYARARGGLSGILLGRVRPPDAIVRTEIPNLSLLPCGRMPHRPVEALLRSDQFRRLMEDLRKDYGYIVFDSPPVGKVPEALELAKSADFTILVVRSGRSSKRLARNVLDRLGALEDSSRSGVILNGYGSCSLNDPPSRSEPYRSRAMASGGR